MVDGAEVKLLRTVWFRRSFCALRELKSRLSAFVQDILITDHVVKVGWLPMRLSEDARPTLRVAAKFSIPDTVKPDLDLMVTLGRLWGEGAVERLRFSDAAPKPSGLAGLLHGLRS